MCASGKKETEEKKAVRDQIGDQVKQRESSERLAF